MPASKPSSWTLDNLHPCSGSCVADIDWHGLQYGLYCLRTKASPLKAKVTLSDNKLVFTGGGDRGPKEGLFVFVYVHVCVCVLPKLYYLLF